MATTTSSLFVWKDAYKVGVNKIDAQHRTLVSLLNKLHQAMSEGRDREALASILDELLGYTKFHFRTEEQLMEQTGFPELAQHRSQHAALTRKVLDFQRDFATGKVALSVQLMSFLKDWLTSHIMKTDKRYSSHLLERGVK